MLDEESRIKAREHRGMTESKIEGLERVQFFKGDVGEGECAICMIEPDAAEEVILLSCNHYFHPECLEPWLQTNATCPKCKQRVRE